MNLDQKVWHKIRKHLRIADVGRLLCTCKYFGFFNPLCEESQVIWKLRNSKHRLLFINYLLQRNYKADSDIVDRCVKIFKLLEKRKTTLNGMEDGLHIFYEPNAVDLVKPYLLHYDEIWIVCVDIPPDGTTVLDFTFSLGDLARSSERIKLFYNYWLDK